METATTTPAPGGGVAIILQQLEAAGSSRKRALEEREPEFVAGKDGAYGSWEMPKRFKFPEAIDAEDARTTAVYVRAMILSAASSGTSDSGSNSKPPPPPPPPPGIN